MNTTPEKTPTREEQIRRLVASARKDIEEDVAERKRMAEESAKKMEAAEARSRELCDALEGLLNEPAKDDQQPQNLESKMDEAVNRGEPVRLQSLDAPEGTAFATRLSPLETFEVKKVVSKRDNLVVSDHEPARVDQKLAPELVQEKARLGAGDSSPAADGSPSVDDEEPLRAFSQDASRQPDVAKQGSTLGRCHQANDGAVSLGEIRALKATDDKRGRNG